MSNSDCAYGDLFADTDQDTDEGSPPRKTAIQALSAIFESASFNLTQEDMGPIVVRERHEVAVIPIDHFLVFLGYLYVKSGQEDWGALLELANRINRNLPAIRATAEPDGFFILIDWHLPLDGGLNKRKLVSAMRIFNDLITDAGRLDYDNMLRSPTYWQLA